MKVAITHLKAPWPSGKGIGDVVELKGDTMPAWAVGKCTPLADPAKAEKPAAGDKTEGTAAG